MISMRRQLSHQNNSTIASTIVDLTRSSSLVPIPPTNATSPKCAVCLEPCSVRTRNVCPTQCEGSDMCLLCSKKFWKDWLNRSRYVVAPPRCVGCKEALSVNEWKQIVGKEMFDCFVKNIMTQFLVRCPYCDQDTYFFANGAEETSATRRQDVLAVVFSHMEDERQRTAFVSSLDAFSRHEKESAKKLVDTLIDGTGSVQIIRQLMTPKDFRKGDLTDDTVAVGFDGGVLDLALDIERRAALQLEWLRRPEAKVATECCAGTICFSCKYDTWHQGETCQEVIASTWEELPMLTAEKIFHCPKCFVPTVHAGGCSSMRCVCGEEYSLDYEE